MSVRERECKDVYAYGHICFGMGGDNCFCLSVVVLKNAFMLLHMSACAL